MHLNLIQFQGLEDYNSLAQKFGDDAVIIAQNSFGTNFEPLEKASRKNKPRALLCKVIEHKDNNELQKSKKQFPLVAVRGGSPEMNAWAANQKVDLLIQPFNTGKNSMDMATANVLAENNVYTVFLFNEFLSESGFRQTQLMKNASLALKLLDKADAPILFVSGAARKEDLRAAKDLASFAVMLGLKKEKALKAVRKNPEMFLERIR